LVEADPNGISHPNIVPQDAEIRLGLIAKFSIESLQPSRSFDKIVDLNYIGFKVMLAKLIWLKFIENHTTDNFSR
jgi:hypothetical protein